MLRGASAEQRSGHLRGGSFGGEAGDIAEVQLELRGDRAAAILLGHQDHFDSAGKSYASDAGFDVGRGGIEGLTIGDRGFAGVVAEGGFEIRRGSDYGAIGRGFGNELADGLIGGFEIQPGYASDVFGRDLLDAVTIQEEQAPIAHGGPFAEVATDRGGILEGLLPCD